MKAAHSDVKHPGSGRSGCCRRRSKNIEMFCIPEAGDDKRRWVKRLLAPEVIINIVLRKEKPYYCTGPDCILIDDYEKNIREWEAIGGTGILFNSAEDAENRLKELAVL